MGDGGNCTSCSTSLSPPLPTPNPPTPHSRVFFSGRRSLLQVDYRVYREEGGATAAATARIPVPVCRCVADRPLIDICAVGSLHRCQKTPLPPPPLPAFCPPLSPSPRRSPGLSPPLSWPLSPGLLASLPRSPGLSPPVSRPFSLPTPPGRPAPGSSRRLSLILSDCMRWVLMPVSAAFLSSPPPLPLLSAPLSGGWFKTPGAPSGQLAAGHIQPPLGLGSSFFSSSYVPCLLHRCRW